jgi:hypothetical protein
LACRDFRLDTSSVANHLLFRTYLRFNLTYKPEVTIMLFRLIVAVMYAFAAQCAAAASTPEQIVEALRKPENSSGNIADAVETATGDRGWMNPDMKPQYSCGPGFYPRVIILESQYC